MFIGDDELHRDFTFINVPEKIPKKIYFYFYKIKYSPCLHNKPYIVILLEKHNKTNEMLFPQINVSIPMNFSTFSNIQSLFLDLCLDGLANFITSHSVLTNYRDYYKGFCNTPDNNIVVVFDGRDLDKHSFNNDIKLTPCILDEILNHNRVDKTKINDIVFNSILQYEELIFLRNSVGENETIPYILYAFDGGDARRDKNGKYGNFFYFVSPLTNHGITGKKYIVFIDHEKVYLDTEGGKIDDVKMMESSIVFFIDDGIPHWCIKDINLFDEVSF